MSDEIFEKLRKKFVQKRCPTLTTTNRLVRERLPELCQPCECTDVIHTDEWAMPHTFVFSTIFAAKVDTKCFKFELELRMNDLNEDKCKITRKGGLTAIKLREQMKMIGHREGEFFAYSGDRKHFNADHVEILGVAVSRSRLRRALMYQNDQVFEVKSITLREEHEQPSNGFTPMLHFIGDKHHIIVVGQHSIDTAKYELGCYPVKW